MSKVHPTQEKQLPIWTEAAAESLAHVEVLQAAYPRLFAAGAAPAVSVGVVVDHERTLLILDALLDDVQVALFRVEQIWQKDGTIRFSNSVGGRPAVTLATPPRTTSRSMPRHVAQPQSFPADAVDAATASIAAAERLTATTCGTCSAPGTLRMGGWILRCLP